jgi:spermidine synthase
MSRQEKIDLSADHNQLRQALAARWGQVLGEPVVHGGRYTRSLCFDALGVQSSMRKSAPFELNLAYTRAMMSFLLFRPEPKDILIVGPGGGWLSKYCFRHLPSTRVTTVELDDRVIRLREQFFIPPDSERFRIVHANAATYLEDKVGIADVILLDGFDEFGLPGNLSSQRFYDSCYTALRHEGVLVANLLHNDAQLTTSRNRIRDGCSGTLFCTVALRESNIIAIGGKQHSAPGWSELYARAAAITTSMGLDLSQYVKKMERYRRMRPVSGRLALDTVVLEPQP